MDILEGFMKKEGKMQGSKLRASQAISRLDQSERGKKGWETGLEKDVAARLWSPLWTMERTLDSIPNVGKATGGS